ncbi:uncharacterized protein [Vicugna pacos]|uniref:Uncharacterized protein isoform X7 n=1 Tax=Vicugna pacos TaxID=30538 RepID=A0ABM5C8P6_VICPA
MRKHLCIACWLSETVRTAVGRGLCEPKSAAVALACGKCHQAALRFVAQVTAVHRPPQPCDRRGRTRPRREYRTEKLRQERGRWPAVPGAPLSPPLHGLTKSVLLLGTLPPPYEEGRASLPKRWGSA